MNLRNTVAGFPAGWGLTTYLPHKMRGLHRVRLTAWQIIGGRTWSLVFMKNIKPIKPVEHKS